MLSYKEYKQLNESLYNLGIRSPNVISEPIGKTGVDTLEEAKAKKKCGKMMKKGMEDEELEDDEEKDVEDSEENTEKAEKPEDVEKDSDDSEESEESEGDEEKDAEDSAEEDKIMMMKKKMKKKSKKEWSEIESDLNDLIEGISNPEALLEVKKALEMMKKGMKKCACSESQMSEEEKAWWTSVKSMI